MEPGAATKLQVTQRPPHCSPLGQGDAEHRCIACGLLQGAASGFLGASAAPRQGRRWQPCAVALLATATSTASLRPPAACPPFSYLQELK